MEVARSFCCAGDTTGSTVSAIRCFPEATFEFATSTGSPDYNTVGFLMPLPSKPRKPRTHGGDPVLQRLSREERRRRRRCTEKYRNAHATRERARIEAFNHGFGELRKLLHIYPPDKKLSKIEILRSAIAYIAFLKHILES